MNFVVMPSYSREEKFMARALDIARRGEGKVSPNPLVGAVIVYEDKIIAEGWHEYYGGPHAEVNAINQVSDEVLSKSEIYVSLEPCSHFGKTAPCSDLIISKKIPKVFVSIKDPNPLVAGKGIKKMEMEGINVETGILEEDGRWVNRRFLTRIEKKRPYIILKWAQSADGFIAGENGEPIKISNNISQIYSHKLRVQEDAILIGTQTAIKDNPSLSSRNYIGSNPIRLTFDFQNRINTDSNILNSEAQTIIYTFNREEKIDSNTWLSLNQQKDIIKQVLDDLYSRNINSVIIEGGTKTLNKFLYSKIYDEIHVFKGDLNIKKGIIAPEIDLERARSQKILKSDVYYFF